MPTKSKYGIWPRSGELDMMESRGNVKYGGEHQIGVEHVSSTLHFGPSWDQNAYKKTDFHKNSATGFNKDFHRYEFIWNEKGIRFFVDGNDMGFVPVGDGFWKLGGFDGDDIWASGTKMAPFDEEV